MHWLHVPTIRFPKPQASLQGLQSYCPMLPRSAHHDKSRGRAVRKSDSTERGGGRKGNDGVSSHLGISLLIPFSPSLCDSPKDHRNSSGLRVICPPGGIQQCWLSQVEDGGATHTLQVDTRDAAKHPAKHRTAPTTELCSLHAAVRG